MDRETFGPALAELGLPQHAEQLHQYAQYYDYLVAENQKMNLTGITDEPGVYLKHFYDSLTLVTAVPQLKTQALSLCDVGAGAGFPSLPVKIALPQLTVSIVDSLNKRIGFLQRLTAKLGLQGVQLYHDRAETFGGKKSPHRQAYDVVTARAVAPLNVLAELCLPLVKIGGVFVAMKAAHADAELELAQTAIRTLGGEITAAKTLTLPESGDSRSLIVITKRQATPKAYPRKPGTPSKLPLGGK
ncbi:16S rRNA (guanine(527)-N(7))-methyltransferase RsmG [Lacticaseibacillus baoqingensis]|uniref:Ribosomal RNA small subunit methyltransferase G n=1 Tax=Lacticaseibacillus baoqingensis TaxID=2486013 RepID=A0ABW4E4Z2_9LACO|nr:16S rRNA (guanine(527)-N(7))-methyltransferase RsmG [Lacticaseibacillus baoqingensis]